MILTAPFIKGDRFPWNPKSKTRPAYVCTKCRYVVTFSNDWWFERCDTCKTAAAHYERAHNAKAR